MAQAEAVSVTVAKAVVDMILAATLSTAVEPERSYADWELPLKDATGLKVDVVAVTTEQTIGLGSRGSLRYVVPIDVAVRKKFVAGEEDGPDGRVAVEDVDALVLLMEEIHVAFVLLHMTGYGEAAWTPPKLLVCPHIPHLKDNRQFTGIVRLNFQVDKEIPTL